MRPVLAIDIGGTKLAAAVIDPDGRIRGRSRVPVPRTDDAEDLFETLLACAAAALRGADTLPTGIDGIGCGCGGPMRWPDGRVSPINIPAWRDYPLRDRLAEEFQQPTVQVHNDAVALVAGEHWKGAGRGIRNLLAVTVSTGVGGGLVLDGHLHHGTSGNAGHIGHVVVEPDGPTCACGGRGCLEAVSSGPSTVERALAQGWRPPAGAEPDGQTLAAAAAHGDTTAHANLERAGRGVGVALASSTHLLDLDTAVIAGGFAQSGPAFWDSLRAAFHQHARMPFAAALRIVPSQIPADAGLLGAATFVLAPDRYGWDAGTAAGPSPA
jgi:glucokinase